MIYFEIGQIYLKMESCGCENVICNKHVFGPVQTQLCVWHRAPIALGIFHDETDKDVSCVNEVTFGPT